MQGVSSHLPCTKSCSSHKFTPLGLPPCLCPVVGDVCISQLRSRAPVSIGALLLPLSAQLHWRGRGCVMKERDCQRCIQGTGVSYSHGRLLLLWLRFLCSHLTIEPGGHWIWVADSSELNVLSQNSSWLVLGCCRLLSIRCSPGTNGILISKGAATSYREVYISYLQDYRVLCLFFPVLSFRSIRP